MLFRGHLVCFPPERDDCFIGAGRSMYDSTGGCVLLLRPRTCYYSGETGVISSIFNFPGPDYSPSLLLGCVSSCGRVLLSLSEKRASQTLTMTMTACLAFAAIMVGGWRRYIVPALLGVGLADGKTDCTAAAAVRYF